MKDESVKCDRHETVGHFYLDTDSRALCATTFYTAADGRVRISNSTIKNENVLDANALRDQVLESSTEFVRQRWHRMEVSTPMTNEYGRVEGGYKRMLLERAVFTEPPNFFKAPRP